MSAVLSSGVDVAAPSRAVASVSEQDPVVGAIERLALSRERLRTTMMPAPQKSTAHAFSGGTGSFTANLTDRLKDLPGATLLLDAVRSWWAQHPMRTASLVAAEASRKFAAPLAERNPLALILGAVVVGALFALTRPWRWALRPAIFAGLVPALAARVMRQLPLESWLRMFASVSARSARDTVSGNTRGSATPVPSTTPSEYSTRPGAPDSSSVPPAATTSTAAPSTYSHRDSIHAPVP